MSYNTSMSYGNMCQNYVLNPQQQQNGWSFTVPQSGLYSVSYSTPTYGNITSSVISSSGSICIQGVNVTNTPNTFMTYGSLSTSGGVAVGGSVTIGGVSNNNTLNPSNMIIANATPSSSYSFDDKVPLEKVEKPADMCAICHDTEIENQWRRSTKCQHDFHKKCLIAHIEAQRHRHESITCPMCRTCM